MIGDRDHAPRLNADGLPEGQRLNPNWEVSPRHVRDAMRSPETDRPLLLDCRRQEEWNIARIDGAVLLPMDEVARRIDEIRDLAGERPIIVYCHHGRRSLRVAAVLREAGFEGATSMAGGIDLWSIDIDPAVARY